MRKPFSNANIKRKSQNIFSRKYLKYTFCVISKDDYFTVFIKVYDIITYEKWMDHHVIEKKNLKQYLRY